ncbi:MAG TPA: hypothetical protein VK853_05295 [Ilumatobacteraceae bacterium]|nr:hypothetical protein [Ilumatobacteraceae bacterium]
MNVAVELTELAELHERVAPLALAHERTLPVADAFAELVGGLVRGRTLACQGPAATSTALALVAPAMQAGAWMAVVDVPAIGLDAARELGVPLERVVAVASGTDPARWPEVVAAAADGFDILVVRVPTAVPAGPMRKLGTRLRQRDVVTVVLGDPGPMGCDGILHTEAPTWTGLGDGHGHLRTRDVAVRASGRRLPGLRRCQLALPA